MANEGAAMTDATAHVESIVAPAHLARPELFGVSVFREEIADWGGYAYANEEMRRAAMACWPFKTRHLFRVPAEGEPDPIEALRACRKALIDCLGGLTPHSVARSRAKGAIAKAESIPGVKT